ncbi:uncharacterized protein B0H18DRAFT_537358 [Fomitopsis serialis]|uniref:uncharacterized protein n=1 Tax=Fomitopsis serialis TaxID=139415 RepID=UPI0020085253|nr:uncharacterized protein B0H18DRAFT_537358 [Neoantrodia serialis]KAH9921773.1 hypothetical protein B0H18DRAFT_537358 [Neoantrodia serialis]
MLGDSHSGSSGLPSTSPSRGDLTRSRFVACRTLRSSSRSYSPYNQSSEDTSEKENSGSYTRPRVDRPLSTLETYTSSHIPARSYAPTPSSWSCTRSTDDYTRSSDEPRPDSEVARSMQSATSIPSSPSESIAPTPTTISLPPSAPSPTIIYNTPVSTASSISIDSCVGASISFGIPTVDCARRCIHRAGTTFARMLSHLSAI